MLSGMTLLLNDIQLAFVQRVQTSCKALNQFISGLAYSFETVMRQDAKGRPTNQLDAVIVTISVEMAPEVAFPMRVEYKALQQFNPVEMIEAIRQTIEGWLIRQVVGSRMVAGTAVPLVLQAAKVLCYEEQLDEETEEAFLSALRSFADTHLEQAQEDLQEESDD